MSLAIRITSERRASQEKTFYSFVKTDKFISSLVPSMRLCHLSLLITAQTDQGDNFPSLSRLMNLFGAANYMEL